MSSPTDQRSDRGLDRRLVALAGFVVMFALGAVYAWSVFVDPLQQQFGWSRWQATLPYIVLHAMIFVGTFTGGRLQDRAGPRIVGVIGVVVYGAGVALGGWLTHLTGSLVVLTALYGVAGGLGLGFAYIAPPSMLGKWFPDRRGLANGVAVGGFGAGALVTAPLGEWLAGTLDGGVPSALVILGLAYLVLGGLAALAFQDPPEPAGGGDAGGEDTAEAQRSFSLSAALRTPQWYLLTGMFTINVIMGNALISQASPIAQDLTTADAATAAAIVGVLGLFNAGGRLGWATLSDKIGRMPVFMIMFPLQAVLFAVAPWVGVFVLFALIAGIIVSCYGAGFSVMPSVAADYYGTAHAGAIYGGMVVAWSIGGVVGPLSIAGIYAVADSFVPALWLFAGIALVTVILPVSIKRPDPARADADREPQAVGR